MNTAGLKEKETLQINLVGTDKEGLRNVMVITDGELKARGMVGNTRFYNGRYPGKAVVPFRGKSKSKFEFQFQEDISYTISIGILFHVEWYIR